MEKAIFLDFFNGLEGYKEKIVYIGNETCQEFFYKNLNFYLRLAKKIKEKNKKCVVLVLPPLTDLYFNKIMEKIKNNSNLFDEITVNDFGSFFKLKDDFKINLGRQLIKFKTGNINLEKYKGFVKDDNLKEIKKPLIGYFLIKKLRKKINLIELNPVIQNIDLIIFKKENLNFALHWPFVLNSTSFMCWSKVENKFKRVVNCDLSCKFSKTNFLDNFYFIKGNANYFKNKKSLEDYLKELKGMEKIVRVVFNDFELIKENKY